MKTTLNQILNKTPCKDGYRKLLTFLNKDEADDEPLALSVILESNGIHDTVWCLRAVEGFDTEKRMFAIFCAKQVQHLLTDQRSINAIEVSERYVNGKATAAELKTASDAARAATHGVARTADPAYFNAAYSASRAADPVYSAAAYSAYSAYSAAAYAAAYFADYYANAADPEIKPILDAYLVNLVLETEK